MLTSSQPQLSTVINHQMLPSCGTQLEGPLKTEQQLSVQRGHRDHRKFPKDKGIFLTLRTQGSIQGPLGTTSLEFHSSSPLPLVEDFISDLKDQG